MRRILDLDDLGSLFVMGKEAGCVDGEGKVDTLLCVERKSWFGMEQVFFVADKDKVRGGGWGAGEMGGIHDADALGLVVR